MKLTLKTVSVLALIASTSMASAGGLAEPIMTMEPMVIADAVEPSSSSAGIIIPLILITLIAVAVSSSGGGDSAVGAIVDNGA